MKIATFNVNSIKAHLEQVVGWLKTRAPDVLCLQEIKCVDEAFPIDALEALGYHAAIFGQKTYNGVAILSKHAIEDVTRGLPDFPDEQSRYIEAVIADTQGPVRVACLYLPNGNPAPGPKFEYKLRWMAALEAHAEQLLKLEEPLVLAGDYNVIPAPEDVHDPALWKDDALFRLETRQAYRRLTALGFTDAIRACHAEAGLYSFWDYQAGAWPRNHGIRIDHCLLSPQAADRLTGAGIDRDIRGWDRPSDHVPVWCTLQ